jgi:3,2-trans-enoyl-CoA isomerase
MEIVHIEYHEDVACMKLARSITNPLNLQLINELSETLRKVNQDSHIQSIVLTSSNEKFFSIGFDVRELYTLSRADFAAFYRAFNRFCIDLYTVQKPTVAAITGHAIAGGCALTLCCDYRYIAEGRKLMGFNVVRLGLPVPYLVGCILHDVVGMRVARNIADSGEFYSSDQLLEMGLVDCVVPQEEVIPRAVEKAHLLAALPQKAFAATKRYRTERIEAQISAHLAEKEQLFINCWFSDETRNLIRKAMEKF